MSILRTRPAGAVPKSEILNCRFQSVRNESETAIELSKKIELGLGNLGLVLARAFPGHLPSAVFRVS